jgi:L,D-transpeptidase catalytic domain
MTTRRMFLARASGALASFAAARVAYAEPHADEAQWIANHIDTLLLGSDGKPTAGLPIWTRMRILRGLPNGFLQVWVPRFSLVGRVPISDIGPVPIPASDELEAERLDGPEIIGGIGLPGRMVGGGNLRTWPGAANPLVRTLGHNAPVRALDSVVGDDGDEWYRVHWLDGPTYQPIALGYVHNSLVRLPRLRYTPRTPDRASSGRHLEADLKEPALLVAVEDGGPVWSSLTLKGTVSNRTPTGRHHILWRVPNETMTSERVYPPIPRDEPGGYYLKNVLWTQYFTADGASIHYNYWSSNWGYAGSHGCLGIGYNEAKFAWDWADVGTTVYVFA